MKNSRVVTIASAVVFGLLVSANTFAQPATTYQLSLKQTQASHFARLALKCVRKEFPQKLDHTMNDASEVRNPKQLHPAFYGCFDWHSTVHGHWMLIHLLKTFPNLTEGRQIREALDDNLSAKTIAAEVAYLNQKSRASFERTYGWAWLLKLAEELHGWNDEDGRKWSRNLQRWPMPLPRDTWRFCRSRIIQFAPACIRTRRLVSLSRSTTRARWEIEGWKR